jgi:hypothetical protein
MRHRILIASASAIVVAAVACGQQNPAQPSTPDSALTQTAVATASTAGVPHPSAKNSEQVVFSGVAAIGSSFPNGSPVGFWIWCEADSTNPYAGECNGAMYFYALGITRHVDDAAEIQELSEGVYKITVASTTDSSIACTLQNAQAPSNGPHNTVTVTCTTPSGSATSNTAVVNVTGP